MAREKILVCAHKQCEIPKTDYLMPLHVGKALTEKELGFVGDNSGDNISIKNRNYCELTGLYWGWKNLDVDYLGLCHYRRYFDFKGKNPKEFLGNYDIILPKLNVLTMRASDQLMHLTTRDDFYIMLMALLKLYPEYKDTVLKYLFNSNKCSLFNMLFCKKEIYDDYCKWLFSIFEEMEKWVKLSSYSRLARLYGFLSEYLLLIYCKHNNLRIKYASVCSPNEKMELHNTESFKVLLKDFTRTFVRNAAFLSLPREKKIPVMGTNIVGFMNDGIPYIDENENILDPK
ncbi:MAG: DUF4422 domain-containing protein [Bacteroidales bacterium]|nr:DUF4422 domain-containing protein [Bacteroidales bacterium]